MSSDYRLQRVWNEVLRYTPRFVRSRVRAAAVPLLGRLESISVRQNRLIPPLKMRIWAGFGNWDKIGEEFLDLFVDLADLTPEARVLEVGCGYGRISAALTGYLGARGTYEGFDVGREAVEWCAETIGSRFPNFHFRFSDVLNHLYNPTGAHNPSEYVFPYGDASFDFVYLTSVFTHMLPADLENYFREIARVLRSGGRCLITYFLLNDESVRLIDAGESIYDFRATYGDCRVVDPKHPEGAIAYDEAYVRRLHAENGLEILEPIEWGLWCGRRRHRSFQDIVVAEKP